MGRQKLNNYTKKVRMHISVDRDIRKMLKEGGRRHGSVSKYISRLVLQDASFEDYWKKEIILAERRKAVAQKMLQEEQFAREMQQIDRKQEELGDHT